MTSKKMLSRDSNYTVDVIMWPKYGKSSISMREVIITSNLWKFHKKNPFFDGWFWFKFNNLGLALGKNLKFYTSMAKGLKLTVRKFWGLTPTFAEVTGQKLVGSILPPSILNMVKSDDIIKSKVMTFIIKKILPDYK